MNIYALPGHKVVVTNRTAKAGYSIGQQNISDYLGIGVEYAVLRTEVGRSHTNVYLDCSANAIAFNSVNFIDVEPQSKEDDMKHPDYAKYNPTYETAANKECIGTFIVSTNDERTSSVLGYARGLPSNIKEYYKDKMMYGIDLRAISILEITKDKVAEKNRLLEQERELQSKLKAVQSKLKE